jgi:hypothetical protein
MTDARALIDLLAFMHSESVVPGRCKAGCSGGWPCRTHVAIVDHRASSAAPLPEELLCGVTIGLKVDGAWCKVRCSALPHAPGLSHSGPVLDGEGQPLASGIKFTWSAAALVPKLPPCPSCAQCTVDGLCLSCRSS